LNLNLGPKFSQISSFFSKPLEIFDKQMR
jgi:hypothetical protein